MNQLTKAEAGEIRAVFVREFTADPYKAVEFQFTTKAEVVATPITVKVCSHMMKALGLKDGDVRELTLDLSDGPWVFKHARIALDAVCDCEGEASGKP